MIRKAFAPLLAILGALIVAAAEAAYSSTPVFSQDFEDADTYKQEMTQNRYVNAVFNQTTDATAEGTSGTVSQYERTVGGETTHYYFSDQAGKDTKFTTFMFPSSVTSLTDGYKLEFDWQLMGNFYNYGSGSGLAIQGSTGPLATFYIANAPSSGTAEGSVYRGDDNTDTLGKVTVAARGSTPKDDLWLHVTVEASQYGVYLSVTQNGTAKITNAKLSDAFDTVVALYQYSYANNTYGRCVCMDDIAVYPRADVTYVWTGATDNTWTTAGNWTIDGEVATDAPSVGDKVSITKEQLASITDFSPSYTESEGVKTITGLYKKSEYYWTGLGDDNLWTNPTNWAYGSGATADAYPKDDVTAVFPASFTEGVAVDFDANTKLSDVAKIGSYSYPYGTMIVDCAVTFKSTGTTRYYVNPLRYMNGNGSLKLENIRFYTTTYARGYEINCGLVVGENAAIYLRGNSAAISINGAMTGTGDITFDGDGNSGKSYAFNGDLSAFAGTMSFSSNSGISYNFKDVANATVACATLNGGGTFSNTGSSAITLEVGSGTLPAFSGDWNLKKVGTGNLTLVAGYSFAGEISKEGTGRFAISVPKEGGWISGVATNLLTGVFAANTFSADDFEITLTGEGPNYMVTIDNSAANAVTITLSESSYVWNGGAEGEWSVAANWLFGGETATAAPGADDTVSFKNDATVYVAPDQVSGTIYKSDHAVKLALLLTAAGTVGFTTPTGFETTDILAAGPFTLAYADGVWTATRVGAAFSWTGAAGDGRWHNTGNWSVNGAPTGVVPGDYDTTTFATAAAVTVDTSDAHSSNMVVNAGVSFASPEGRYLMFGPGNSYEAKAAVCTVSGSGALTLAGITVRSGYDLTLGVPLVIAEGTVNTLMVTAYKVNSSTMLGFPITVNGAISGSGKLCITQSTGNTANANAGVLLYGDMSDFTGEMQYYLGSGSSGGVRNYQQRAGDFIYAGAADGSNARWDIYHDYWSYQDLPRYDGNMFGTADTTYKFGSLKLRLPNSNRDNNYQSNVTLEVGKLDEDSIITYSWKSAYNAGVNWIAPTATWTQNAANQAFLNISGGGKAYITSAANVPATISLTVDGGTLMVGYDLVDDVAVPVDLSANIKNSTAAIVFDDQGTNVTWATALDASNTSKAIVKYGTGTLTLSKVPAWEGKTTLTVVQGEVKVPEGASIMCGTMTRLKETSGGYKIYERGNSKGLIITGGLIRTDN